MMTRLTVTQVKKVNSELHEDDADAEEWASIPDNIKYIQPLLRLLALLHLFIAFSLMVAYYFLKVRPPLPAPTDASRPHVMGMVLY